MKLTPTQAARLSELKTLDDACKFIMQGGRISNHASCARATTLNLVGMGLAEFRGRKIAKTGRVMAAGTAHITPDGREALAAHEATIAKARGQ